MRLLGEDITVRLGGRTVLDGVGVDVGGGEIIAVIGPNGAGKSTLLRMLAGVAAPTTGRVSIDGKDVRAIDQRTLGRSIAYLPQDRTVHWPLSVRRVVNLGRLPHGTSPDDAAIVQDALTAMDLGDLAERAVNELSGGELARVLQARALAQGAAILVADEPTAGLDMAHVLHLFDHFKRLAADGRTVIVALHDVALAVRFCHKTILLKGGKVLAAGASAEVVTEQHLATAFGVVARIATLDHVPIVIAEQTLT